MPVNWKNIPIPGGHLIPLILGILAQGSIPLPLGIPEWLRYALGIPLLLAGITLAGWAVRAVGKVDVEDPERLITTGPYAFSRNPMYLAWDLIYAGAIFLTNTSWLLLLFTFVLAYTHYRVILPEEVALRDRFGEVYRAYCKRVRRYF